jgi:dihydroflavonol-4-reductase
MSASSSPSKILITGASGFLGLHTVEALRAQYPGAQLRSLGRSTSKRLEPFEVEQVQGSVTSDADVAAAMAGVDAVYHLAGAVSRSNKDNGALHAVHVGGTRRIMQAALDLGVDDVLVLSTSGTVGVSKDRHFIATEDDPIAWDIIREWAYYESKGYAEKEVAKFVAKGLPVKMARPTLLLGPGDYNGSSTGDVVKFLCGDIPAALPGGMSLVDVRDVAAVLPAIMADGEAGVGYLLGAENMSIRSFMIALEQVSGVKAPAMTLPRGLINRAEGALKWFSSLKAFGGLAPQTFEMGCHYWSIDSTRAEALGFAPRTASETLVDTVAFL